jgi:hypothetical protein
MKRLCAIWLFSVLALSLPAPIPAAIITTPITDQWEIEFDLSPGGDGALVSPVCASESDGNGIAIFQVQGLINLAMTGKYKGQQAGTVFLAAVPYQIGLNLTPSANKARYTCAFEAEPFFSMEWPQSHTMLWQIGVTLTLRDAEGGYLDSYDGMVSLVIDPYRHITLGGSGLTVFDLAIFCEDGAVTRSRFPVVGETYQISTTGALEVSPDEVVTTQYYDQGVAGWELTCPLSVFDNGLGSSGKVRAEGGGRAGVSRTVTLPFATVDDANWPGVELKDRTTGEWTTLTTNTALYKGDWIRLLPTPIAGSIHYPSVRVRFADGQMREVALEYGYDPDKIGETIIEVGQGELLSHPVCWTIRFTNFIQDSSLNGREYAKEFVWSRLADAIVDAALPGSSWIVRKPAEEVIEYGLERVYDAVGGQDAPRPKLSNRASQSAAAAGSRAAGTTFGDTADAVMTIKGDGSLAVANRVGSTRVVNAAQQTRLLPPRSQIEHTTSFGPISTLPYASDTPIGSLALSPADGESVDTRTPLLTVNFLGFGARFLPETLDLRINGVLADQFVTRTATQGAVQVSQQASLHNGANTIEASVIEVQSGRQSVTGTLYASAPPVAPKRVVAAPGQTSMLLSWLPSQERGLEGYHIYKGDTAGAVTTRLTSSPVSGSAYALYAAAEPGLAAGAWYAVTAVVSGEESALSTPVQGSLAGPAATPPDPVTDLAATTAYDRISLNFTPPAGAIAFRLARPGLDPLVFRSPPFVDTTAARGTPHTYTVTPLGLDLAPGTPVETTAAIAAATPPPAPTGATAYAADAEGKTWNLRWDPVQVAGIIGVNIYEARIDGTFVKVTGTPVAGTTFTRTLPGTGVYAWRFLTVSSEGVESTDGPVMGGGYAPKASLGASSGASMLLLLRE